MKLKNIFFDTETTGLNPGQIGQIAYIVEGENGVEEAKNIFYKVDSVESGAQRIHGFSAEDFNELSNGKRFIESYEELHDVMRDKRLVAHNVGFDIKFISSEFWRCGVSFQPLEKVCTMEFFKGVLKIPARTQKYGKYKNPKLTEVIEYFKLDQEKIMKYSVELFGNEGKTQGYHDARFDTTAMFVAANVARDISLNKTDWLNRFKL